MVKDLRKREPKPTGKVEENNKADVKKLPAKKGEDSKASNGSKASSTKAREESMDVDFMSRPSTSSGITGSGGVGSASSVSSTATTAAPTSPSTDPRLPPIEKLSISASDGDSVTLTGFTSAAQAKTFLENEMYKVWKKNAMYLYDLMIIHTLTWPSLTVEWIPETPARPTGKDYSIHRMILGTNTENSAENYLIVLRALIANYDLQKVTDFNTVRVTGNGYGAITTKLESYIKIPHEGDIMKARVMPQNPVLVASKSSTGKVFLFDYSKYGKDATTASSSSSGKSSKATCRPQLTMLGSDTQGFGLSWNVHEKGRLLSSDDGGVICIWDVNQTNRSTIAPLTKIIDAHAGLVCDVQWHNFDKHLFASVGSDRALKIWDARQCSEYRYQIPEAHSMDVNSVSFSPHSEYIFLTGSQDKTAALWDLRNLKLRLHQFEGHTDQVYQVSWCPTHEPIFASASADKRVFLWDLSQINHPQSAEDAMEGPSELLFIHGGHTDAVCDFSWHPTEPFLMASVSENNDLDVWKPGEHVLAMMGNEEDNSGQAADAEEEN